MIDNSTDFVQMPSESFPWYQAVLIVLHVFGEKRSGSVGLEASIGKCEHIVYEIGSIGRRECLQSVISINLMICKSNDIA